MDPATMQELQRSAVWFRNCSAVLFVLVFGGFLVHVLWARARRAKLRRRCGQ